jgi:hypothetical protein
MELNKEYFDGEFTDKLSKKLVDSMGGRFAIKDDLKNFATKDDLKNFATKDDLKNFPTKDDLKSMETRLESKFVSKDEFKTGMENFENKFSLKFNNALARLATQESLDELIVKVDDIDKTVKQHSRLLEKNVIGEKTVDDKKFTEAHRLGRAEKHIEQLAKHTNLKLEY